MEIGFVIAEQCKVEKKYLREFGEFLFPVSSFPA